MSLPSYVNCQNEEMEICDYFMHKLCPETCLYAREIRGMGVGAVCDSNLLKRLEEDAMFMEDSPND